MAEERVSRAGKLDEQPDVSVWPDSVGASGPLASVRLVSCAVTMDETGRSSSYRKGRS